MKFDFKDWRRVLKLWAPPLVAIPAMLLLASVAEVARFFLFTHHLFWMIGIILLINPVSEMLSPSTPREMRGRPSPQSSGKARARAAARRARAKSIPELAHEQPAERLARLLRAKNALDRRISKLARKEKENLP